MILFSTNIYTEMDFSKDGAVPDMDSVASIVSPNYLESLIENCIQFFDEYYLEVPWHIACEVELSRILKYPDQTNNLGRLIYSIYYSARSKGKEESSVRKFIYDNFFDPHNSGSKSLYNLYIDKQRTMKALANSLGLNFYEYDKISSTIDKLITGINYDFSKIDIPCTVYRNPDFNIPPSALYQIAMRYDSIILSHNTPNKEYWEIKPIIIDGKEYTSLDECIDAISTRNILVLCCNDDGHTIKNNISKFITIPQYSLISELYIEN